MVLAEHRHNRYGFFIPGGILIGLGTGMIFGRADIGVLIGLGAGFIFSGVFREWGRRDEENYQVSPATSSYLMMLIGVLFMIYGMGLLWFPAMIYPYLSSILVIFLGLWLVINGLRR
jgi:uncharacterized membrane protein HdeD (DUF308 family)